MAAGDPIGDAGPLIAAMRNQELLQRTYGVSRSKLLPECDNPLSATKWQVETDVRVSTLTGGVQVYKAGAIVTHEYVVSLIRRTGTKLRPIG